MKIYAINPINQINFKSKVKKVHTGTVPVELAEKVDVFEETHKNAKKLGSGLFATAYALDDTNYVIKETLSDDYAKSRNSNFFPEAKALSMVPDTLDNTQKLVAHVQTEKNNYYLISTFVSGRKAEYPLQPWSSKSFNGLLKTLYDLDAAGIYHNDVNQANCLIDENGRVSAIDYQFAEKFDPSDASKNSISYKTPPFMMPSNVQMFEMASLPWYLRTMSKLAPKNEVREIFKEYIEAKASYAARRATHMKKEGVLGQKAEYEALQARFFKNPSDEILDLQARKLQVMYSFRKTFSIIDPNGKPDKNIVSAIPSFFCTAKAARDMLIYAQCIKAQTQDPLLKKFMGYEIEFAKYWLDEMINEVGVNSNESVWAWIERNALLRPKCLVEEQDFGEQGMALVEAGPDPKDDLSAKFKVSEDLRFGYIDNIASMVIHQNASKSDVDSDTGFIECIQENLQKLSEKLSTDRFFSPPIEVNKKVMDYELLKEKYISHNKKGIKACNNSVYNAAIPNFMMAVYYGSLAKKALNNLPTNITGCKYKQEQENLISTSVSLELAKLCGRRLTYCLCTPYREKVFDNFYNFDI